jgi:hypothetical protein
VTVGKGRQRVGPALLRSERGGEELCPQPVAGRRGELDSLPSWEREAQLPYTSPWTAMLRAFGLAGGGRQAEAAHGDMDRKPAAQPPDRSVSPEKRSRAGQRDRLLPPDRGSGACPRRGRGRRGKAPPIWANVPAAVTDRLEWKAWSIILWGLDAGDPKVIRFYLDTFRRLPDGSVRARPLPRVQPPAVRPIRPPTLAKLQAQERRRATEAARALAAEAIVADIHARGTDTYAALAAVLPAWRRPPKRPNRRGRGGRSGARRTTTETTAFQPQMNTQMNTDEHGYGAERGEERGRLAQRAARPAGTFIIRKCPGVPTMANPGAVLKGPEARPNQSAARSGARLGAAFRLASLAQGPERSRRARSGP